MRQIPLRPRRHPRGHAVAVSRTGVGTAAGQRAIPGWHPLALLLAGLGFATTASGNDLLRIYGLARDNDPGIVAAQHERDAAAELAPAARALLLPQVTASYSRQFNNSSVEVSYPDPLTGQAVEFSRDNNAVDRNLGVQAQQTLFNLAYWFRLKQAGDQVALAQLNYLVREQALALSTATSYLDRLAAQDQLVAAQAEEAAVRRHLELGEANLSVGLSSATDVRDVRARLDLATANTLSARQQVRLAQLALDQLIEQPLASLDSRRLRVVPVVGDEPDVLRIAPLKADLVPPPLEPASLDDWIDLSLETNFGVLAARLNYGIADKAVSVAWSKHLPSLSATATYNDSRTGGGAFPTRFSGPAVQVGVSIPIFSGGATQSEVRQTLATREQRSAEHDLAVRQTVRDVSAAWQAATIGLARIKALAQAVASSRAALDADQVGLSIGTRSAVDVLDAERQRHASERDLSRARYDYLLALLRLRAAAGRLNAHDLEQVDALLTRAPAR